MSLATNIQNLATRIGTELKAHRTLINGNVADLSALSTTTKTNLVAALNEVNAAVHAQPASPAGAGINDAAPSTTSTYSGTKIESLVSAATAQLVAGAPGLLDTLKELADAIGDDPNYAASTATALGNRVRVDAAQAFTAGQAAQGRSNIGAAASADLGDPNTDLVAVFEAAIA